MIKHHELRQLKTNIEILEKKLERLSHIVSWRSGTGLGTSHRWLNSSARYFSADTECKLSVPDALIMILEHLDLEYRGPQDIKGSLVKKGEE